MWACIEIILLLVFNRFLKLTPPNFLIIQPSKGTARILWGKGFASVGVLAPEIQKLLKRHCEFLDSKGLPRKGPNMTN